MMNVQKASATGYACLSAWSDLLDCINVFPVADGDTGINLRISLAPLRDIEAGRKVVIDQLGRCATGNSGNIAAAFFREFVQAEQPEELAGKAALGAKRAWQAVASPCSGTMLSVFDALALLLEQDKEADICLAVREHLRQTVLDGTVLIPELENAGVVDAGALGMYIFMDGFFQEMTGNQEISVPVPTLFQGRLNITSDFQAASTTAYCVDAVIEMGKGMPVAVEDLTGLGDSLVVVPGDTGVKVHVHTPDPELLRNRLSTLGDITGWSDEPIDERGAERLSVNRKGGCIHILSDAAGSLSRELARSHSIQLLDSYIVAGGQACPESLRSPQHLYDLMRKGSKVTTAQASTQERHVHYDSACSAFGRTLYLCVGSAFTGNYETAMAWKKQHDGKGLFEVVDTGAASGRLALIALLTARFAESAESAEEVIEFAKKIVHNCEEYIFIDEMKYLVAGGRVSRGAGFFGDLLHMKPVISPRREGARKVGLVRNSKEQLAFAVERLEENFDQSASPVIMLQYSDNREWVESTVQQQVRELLPKAEILLTPLSLTSGVHTGPGTWALACAQQPYEMKAAIIIPVYNHEQRIADVVHQALALDLPVFVVDDGSSDRTPEILKTIEGITLLQHPVNQGKGAAIRTGFTAAVQQQYDLAITIDGDGQHIPADAKLLLGAVAGGQRYLVVGKRQGMEGGGNVPWTSRFGRRFSNFWVWVSGGPTIEDSQSGFRLYPLPESLRLDVQSMRYQFEVEILVRARQGKIPICEVPVQVVYQERGQRVSHFRPWVDFMRNSRTFSRLIFFRIFNGVFKR